MAEAGFDRQLLKPVSLEALRELLSTLPLRCHRPGETECSDIAKVS